MRALIGLLLISFSSSFWAGRWVSHLKFMEDFIGTRRGRIRALSQLICKKRQNG